VLEPREDPALLEETLAEGRRSETGETAVQHLHGGALDEPLAASLGGEDAPHAPLAQHADDLPRADPPGDRVGGDGLEWQRAGEGGTGENGGGGDAVAVEEGVGGTARGEQLRHLRGERRVFLRQGGEPRRARRLVVEVEELVELRARPPPALALAGVAVALGPGGAPPRSSRSRKARAFSQSRRTVRSLRPRSSATSASVRPAK
jgi:hypothetical protein